MVGISSSSSQTDNLCEPLPVFRAQLRVHPGSSLAEQSIISSSENIRDTKKSQGVRHVPHNSSNLVTTVGMTCGSHGRVNQLRLGNLRGSWRW